MKKVISAITAIAIGLSALSLFACNVDTTVPSGTVTPAPSEPVKQKPNVTVTPAPADYVRKSVDPVKKSCAAPEMSDEEIYELIFSSPSPSTWNEVNNNELNGDNGEILVAIATDTSNWTPTRSISPRFSIAREKNNNM